jgi:hypothetical protein
MADDVSTLVREDVGGLGTGDTAKVHLVSQLPPHRDTHTNIQVGLVSKKGAAHIDIKHKTVQLTISSNTQPVHQIQTTRQFGVHRWRNQQEK